MFFDDNFAKTLCFYQNRLPDACRVTIKYHFSFLILEMLSSWCYYLIYRYSEALEMQIGHLVSCFLSFILFDSLWVSISSFLGFQKLYFGKICCVISILTEHSTDRFRFSVFSVWVRPLVTQFPIFKILILFWY